MAESRLPLNFWMDHRISPERGPIYTYAYTYNNTTSHQIRFTIMDKSVATTFQPHKTEFCRIRHFFFPACAARH